MAFKNSSTQIIKLVLAGLTFVPLSVGLMGMPSAFVYLGSATPGTPQTLWPAKLTDNFITFCIINQVRELYVKHLRILSAFYSAFNYLLEFN
jgi:hypothetical protein